MLTCNNYNGDNFSTAAEYVRKIYHYSIYSHICELVAVGTIFPFLFEIYYDSELDSKFDLDTFSLKRLRLTGDINSGYFDMYLPISEVSVLQKLKLCHKKHCARYTNEIHKNQIKQAVKKNDQTNLMDYREKHLEVNQYQLRIKCVSIVYFVEDFYT